MNLKTYPAGFILSLFIGIILIILSPEDIVLGSVSKLIYLHGALINSGLFLFIGLGLVSLITLLRKNPKDLSLLFSIEKTVIIFWIAAAISGNITSFLGLGLSLSVWIFMIGAGRIMHPDNPFGASDSSFKFFFAAITFVFLVNSILTVRWMARKN